MAKVGRPRTINSMVRMITFVPREVKHILEQWAESLDGKVMVGKHIGEPNVSALIRNILIEKTQPDTLPESVRREFQVYQYFKEITAKHKNR